MAKSLVITASANLVVPVSNAKVISVILCGGSDASTVEVFDGTQSAGSSIAKLAAVANESAPPLECEIDTTKGVSVTLTGTGSKAFVIYE